MVKIVPLVTFEATREGAKDPHDEWRFERGKIYELIGYTENLFNPKLTYLYLGDWDHCYLVERKDIKIL